ncbi:MAG: DUF1232 domain-containing protein [Hyphomonadaceae bacterium]|nr:DUF1232 domain-containing protein [Hyphomonadaceae bacterium]
MARGRWSLGLLGEAGALALALFDRRTPWSARLIALAVGAYLISPIDLVTDLIPILGLIDDAMIVPLGLWIAGRFIPEAVKNDARAKLSRRA